MARVSSDDAFSSDVDESWVQQHEEFKEVMQIEEDRAEEARTYKRRQLSEMAVYFSFLIVLSLVLANSRDPTFSFWHNHLMKDLFLEEEFPADQTHIYKKFDGVATDEEFWQYMTSVLLPGLYSQTEDGGVMIYGTNRLVGNVRIRSNRVQQLHNCSQNDFAEVITSCYPRYNSSVESEDPYGNGFTFEYRSAADLANNPQQAYFHLYAGGGFALDLNQSAGLEHNIALLSFWRDAGYVDLQTRSVFVDFATYNANINMWCVVQLQFEFLPSGGVWPSYKFRTIRLYYYPETMLGTLQLLGEVAVIGFVMYYFVQEMYQFCTNKRYRRNWWNFYDILNLVLFGVVVGMRVEVARRVASLNPDPSAALFFNFQPIVLLVSSENNIVGLNAALLWFKMFKFTDFSPRMNLINRVLAHSAPSLLSFLVMFVFVLFGFAQAGQVAFGTDIFGFSTFLRSIYTLLIATLGDFDFESLRLSNRAFGPVFFFTFIILVFFIILSMFIAIINSSYEVVYDQVLEEEAKFSIFKMTTQYLVSNPVGRRMMKLVVDENRLRRLEEQLDDADEDGDGMLDLQEMQRFLGNDQETRDMFERYDTNGDHVLSPEEREHLKREIREKRKKLQKEMANPVEMKDLQDVSVAMTLTDKKVELLQDTVMHLDEQLDLLLRNLE